jgi:hypothetical protein
VGRARIVPVALVLVGGLALAAVAQGGGGTSPNFTRADLPRLVFKPSDAPPGMRYVRGPEGSGPRFLEREAEPGDEISRLVQQLRRRGFLISFGVQFFARHERAKIGFLEAIAFLFRNEDSARRGFNFIERAVPGRFESLGRSPHLASARRRLGAAEAAARTARASSTAGESGMWFSCLRSSRRMVASCDQARKPLRGASPTSSKLWPRNSSRSPPPLSHPPRSRLPRPTRRSAPRATRASSCDGGSARRCRARAAARPGRRSAPQPRCGGGWSRGSPGGP